MPLLWLSITFLLGIIFANTVPLPTSTWLILAGIVAGLFWPYFWLKRRVAARLTLAGPRLPAPVPLILLAFCCGGARYTAALPDWRDTQFIGAHNDREFQIELTGIVVNLPDRRDHYTYLRLAAEQISPRFENNPISAKGLVLVRTTPQTEAAYGDRVQAIGFLQTPPEAEEFSYRDYLARQGVYSYLPNAKIEVTAHNQGSRFYRAIYQLKEKAHRTIYQLWPDPEASLFAGILLGIETGIPQPVQEAFKETGTTHIIAISGFNIAIVAALFANGFGKILGPRNGALAATLAIGLYTILVGADAAVVRAAIMGGLSLLARQAGRRQTGINTLAFTAAVMSLHNPHTPWNVGFQLSFAATLGLILYADPLGRAFTRLAARRLSEKTAKKLAGPVGEYFLFTFAAQITTLPIMAYHFGAVSWSAFLANPVILPVQPPIMTVGGLALILGLIWLPLGKIAAPLAWPFVLFTIRVVEFFGENLRGALPIGRFGILWVILFYSILLTLTFGWQPISKWVAARRERMQVAVALPGLSLLSILTVLLWRMVLAAPDGRLHLTVFDVGSGDAILLQTPAGRYILINGGPSASLLSDGLGRRLPPFHRQLDWLVVAAPQKEQVGALPGILARFPPDNVLWAGPESPSREADYLRESLTTQNMPVILAETGQRLDLGRGAQLEVISSTPKGAILSIEWAKFRAILPLGCTTDDLAGLEMGKILEQPTVLWLADGGHRATNPPEWLHNLRPQLVILSVAADDRDGLPHREVLDALGGYSLLRTDQNGWIQISTDGQAMWLAVGK